jgi:glycosyltransferase involved in cell wall biosynthesis
MIKKLESTAVLLVGGGLSGGGAERHFNMLARGLFDGSADVLLVTRPGVPCHRDAYFPLRDGALISLREALRRCREKRYDAIFGFGRYPSFAAFAIRSSCSRATPLILMDVSVFLKAHAEDARRFKALPRTACRLAYSRADLLLANSQSGADDLKILTGGRTPVSRVPNILDPAWIRSTVTASGVTHAPDAPYILSLGRLVPSKRLDSAIHGFAGISTRIPHRLVIAGDGPEKAALQSLVEQMGLGHRILFPGWIAEPLPWLARADVLLHTSAVEGFPNSVLEAMALEVPVVSANWGADAVSLAEAGALRLVESNKPCSIGRALMTLLSDTEGRAAVVETARRECRKHMIPDAIAAYETAVADGMSRTP